MGVPAMVCHHYCNEPLRCPECVRRFWKWAENYSHRFERPKGKRRQAADAARAAARAEREGTS